MGRGGKDTKDNTLRDRGVSEAECVRIELKVLNEEILSTRNSLLRTLSTINNTLDRLDEETPKKEKKLENESLYEIALRVEGMVENVCGLWHFSESRREETLNILGGKKDTLNPDILAAREAKYKIQFNEIVVRHLENRLKEEVGGERKIVISNESFYLPYKIAMRYAELSGFKLYAYKEVYSTPYMWEKIAIVPYDDTKEDKRMPIYTNKPCSTDKEMWDNMWNCNEIKRDSRELVQAVEELGAGSHLKVVVIPDNIEWEVGIQDYGPEWIYEKHKMWE